MGSCSEHRAEYAIKIRNSLPITHYQLPITNYQLPITNYPLPITHYQLPITHSCDEFELNPNI